MWSIYGWSNDFGFTPQVEVDEKFIEEEEIKEMIKEIIKRLEEDEKIKSIISNLHLTGDDTMRALLKLVKLDNE